MLSNDSKLVELVDPEDLVHFPFDSMDQLVSSDSIVLVMFDCYPVGLVLLDSPAESVDLVSQVSLAEPVDPVSQVSLAGSVGPVSQVDLAGLADPVPLSFEFCRQSHSE